MIVVVLLDVLVPMIAIFSITTTCDVVIMVEVARGIVSKTAVVVIMRCET